MLWIRIRSDPELFPGYGIICSGSGPDPARMKKKRNKNFISNF